jgi:small conductance mechanosensitive channel
MFVAASVQRAATPSEKPMLHFALSLLAQATPAAPSAAAPIAAPEPKPLGTAAEQAVVGADVSPDQIMRLVETYGVPVVKAIVLLVVGYIVAGWIGKVIANTCRRAKLDETLVRFLGNFVRWIVLAAVVITCLSSFGVQVGSLVAILGTIGVAIGLALQGSLSHIASGVMLLIFRPFKVGDAVTAGGQTGVVDEVSLFSTILITPDNRKIIIPNGAIVGGVITNATAFEERAVDVNVGIDAGVPVDKARELLASVATQLPGRVASKNPGVALTAMGAANTFNVGVWCKTSDVDATREKLLIACNEAIGKAGFAPAAPVALIKNVS